MKFGDYSSFSFVDVETTGTSASHDRVLEIGIIRVEEGEVVGELNTLIDAGVYIPPEITMITGIVQKDIENAPTFSDVADKVQELLEGSIFVAHNARFDHAFVKHEYRRLGLPFNPKTLDTVRLARAFYPGRQHYNLDAIISLLNISIEHRHRAYDDALVLHKLLQDIHARFEKDFSEKIFKEFLKSPSLPTHISKSQINALPDGPGVYLMYGENDAILYIGKSVDIKARVLSHFYNDFESTSDLKLSRDTRKIDFVQTAGDLGASLLESTLIKTKLPVFNRALRRNLGMVALVEKTKDKYSTVEFVEANTVNPKSHHKILGVFRNKKQATERLREIAKEYKLCPKLLGIEKGKGRCFASQIGLCEGACTKEEPAFKYNARFAQAFANLRVPAWPFPGPIGIKEKFEDLEEIYVVENWCFLGSIKNESEGLENLDREKIKFDWDTYRILYRFIKKHSKNNTILNLHLPEHSFPTEQL